MRLSRSFGKTLREAPADAELISHQLLVRGNFIRPLGAGIYTYMPLGYRVLRRIWAIMSEEMEAIGGQELLMPNLHPAALWQATGRWETLDVLMKVKSAGGREYALSPTHEEVVVDLALREVESYRDLPRVIFHIGKKLRDEPRPRGGLLRLREFIMKDAYSLDPSEAALDKFYPSVVRAYLRIFERCGVAVVPVQADVGAMGGKSSHEFVVPHPQGEDLFIACVNGDYAANVEAAEFVRGGQPPADRQPLARVATPNCTTIADVAAFVGVPTSQTVKAVFYWFTPHVGGDGRLVFALVRGDLEISEVKLVNALGNGELRPATEAEIRAVGAVPGYASAVGLPVAEARDRPGLYVLGDISLEAGGNFVVGANQEGYHFSGANYGRDFVVSRLADIAQAHSGHQCPRCGGRIEARRAIEAGHCFKLGTRYSEAVNATYLDEDNLPRLIHMGSYGIGLDRLMAIIVELYHDDDGIIWPKSVAPYQIHLLPIGKGNDLTPTADDLYASLGQAGFTVLYDDRDVSAGVKFKDADLIGLPIRVAVSARALAGGNVEVKPRATAEKALLPLDGLVAYLRASL